MRKLSLFFTMLLAACGVPKEKYTTLEGQLNECQGKIQRALSDLETTGSAQRTCEERLANLSMTKEELEKKTKTYEDLVTSLKTEIDDGKIKISEMAGRLTVNLIDKILFDSGSTKVKEEGKAALAKIAEVLKTVTDKRVQVEGHTDNVAVGAGLKNRFPTNWELSTARATAVVRFLAEQGMNEGKMSATGYSMFRPVADNATVEGKAQNRRIEVVLVPELAQAPTGAAPTEPVPTAAN